MKTPRKIGFQAKVLIPVVALLILVPAATMWIVQVRNTRHFESETREKLATADAVFRNSLDIRARHLLAQYRNVAYDPRMVAALGLPDSNATVMELLSELHAELEGDEVLLFTHQTEGGAHPDGALLAGHSKDPTLNVDEIHRASLEAIRGAWKGDASIRTIVSHNRLFNAVSIPILKNMRQSQDRTVRAVAGVLTVAVPIGEAAASDLKDLTQSEVVLIANNQVVASTLRDRDPALSFPEWFSQHRDQMARQLLINSEHYLGRAGEFKSAAAGGGLGYLLLFSYEKAWEGMRETQRALWMISVAGIVFSTAIVWIFIGRAARPLQQLRDSAEAVGRGDFSRRVELRTGDEIGELARTFNQMTENLQSSHTELEKTLETLKTTQSQLVQREKLSAVGEFVAGVAHELNNPLTAVIGFTELLQSADLEPKHQTSLGYIIKSAERCQKIVLNLLSFSRQHQPERKSSNLNELIDSVIELIGYDFKRSDIELRRAYAPDLGKVSVDPHQMQQVFVNILTNARHAIEGRGQPGWVRIMTERSRDKVRIILEDNGPGIPADVLPRIFDPFFTTKRVGQGTGLGLSLSYGIIKEHGGTIQAFSEPGCGARFVIELPAVAEEAKSIAAPRGEDSRRAALPEGKRVLVVDDEDWIVRLVENVLRAEGFSVDTVSGGEAALEAVNQGNYDLILCDLRMPGLSGPQLYERARNANEDLARRFVFMTGDVVSETSRNFLKDKKGCLTKPFSPRDLRSVVGRYFGAVS